MALERTTGRRSTPAAARLPWACDASPRRDRRRRNCGKTRGHHRRGWTSASARRYSFPMRPLRTARFQIGLAVGLSLTTTGCGKSGVTSPSDGASQADVAGSSGPGTGGDGMGAGGVGGAGGSATGGAAGAGGNARGGTSGTAGGSGTAGTPGTGGATDICAGKGGNCHPYPTGCQGSQCNSCPCEGGTGGAPGRGGTGGGFATGGASGAGGRGGLDAGEVISCYDANGTLKPSMKTCTAASDCRQGIDVYCCGTDRMIGLVNTANCQLSNPDCSYRACMHWTYYTAEDGNTTETGGTIALRCVTGQCLSYVILPPGVDGARPDGPADGPVTTRADGGDKF
jgi:hypothetical protein